MLRKTSLSTALVALTVTGAAHAVTLSTTYDENVIEANTVDASAAFASGTGGATVANTVNFATFDAAVEAAAALEFGGVLNFDSTISTNDQVATTGIASPISLSFGAGKTLALTYNVSDGDLAFRQAGLTNRTEISGTSVFTVRNELTATNSVATFSFGSLTGGLPNEGVTQAGLTFLSRASRDYAGVSMTASFSNGSTVTSSAAIATAAATGDTFYGFIAPLGSTITSLSVDTGTGIEYSVDDLGIVTSVIPEPGSMALLSLGGLALLGRRRM